MSRTVAIFGGSFDPVHVAHVEVARRARAQLPCDEVWFLPAAQAIHKPAGAAAGASAGLLRGLFRWRDPDPIQQRFVGVCLRRQGYEVIGWR